MSGVTYFVLAFSLLIVFAGVVILLSPATACGLLQRYKGKSGLYAGAIAIRVVLGAALLAVASASKFPLFFQFLGWIALAAAAVFVVIGRNRFDALIDRAIDLTNRLGWLLGVLAMLLGTFIAYSLL